MSVDEPADEDVQNDDEGHAEGRDEEPRLGAAGVLPAHEVAEPADEVEAKQGSHAHGSVQLRPRQRFQSVDDDKIGCLARVDTGNAQQAGDLANGDADGRPCHESADGHEGDELDKESGPDQTQEEEHDARNERQTAGDGFGIEVGVRLLHVEDDVSDNG